MNRCWCGTENPYYAPVPAETCGGTGGTECYCGGDQCVCHNHGWMQCAGCLDCIQDGINEDGIALPYADD